MSITIRDIARQANVSPSTVSRVVNGSGYVSKVTRKKIEQIIKVHDYVPSAMAQRLSKGSNNIVGVMIPEIDNPFFSGIIRGIEEVADKEGLCVILCNSDENSSKEQRLVRVLKEQRIRGLLLTPAVGEHQQMAEYRQIFSQLEVPIVLMDRKVVGGDYDGIYFDDERAVLDITTILIQNGHTHIELLAGNQNLELARIRVNGYKEAFQCSGLSHESEWIHYCLFAQEEGYNIMSKILSRDKKRWPTAVVSNNNMLSLGALRAIFERNLSIPRDIAFVGYDQIDLLEILKLNITLAEKDSIEMGRVAMKMLCERMTREPCVDFLPRKITMMPKVVVRGSEALIK